MNEQFFDIGWPFGGLDKRYGVAEQDRRTTILGNNVRTFDPLAQRGRGGSRPGISKWLEEQCADGVIQHLNTIVTTDAEALGWSFNGQDFGFTGVYGGIGFVSGIGGLGGEIEVNGGGGYMETLSYNERRYHLEMSASSAEGDVGETVSVSATFYDQDGIEANFTVETSREVLLMTSPRGRSGDGATLVTSGVATFNVSEASERTVTYRARDITKRKNSTNTVTVTWEDRPIRFVQSDVEGFGSGDTQTLAWPDEVTAGNLLVVAVSTFAALSTVLSITDTQGNTYTQAGAYAVNNESTSLWYAIAGATSVNEVEVVRDDVNANCLGVLEYSGVRLVNPLDGAVINSGSSDDFWFTGSIPVNQADTLVIAAFSQGSVSPSIINFVPSAGFTLRIHQPNSGAFMTLYVIDKRSASADTVMDGNASNVADYQVIAASFKPEV
jgi:hypothetical protein